MKLPSFLRKPLGGESTEAPVEIVEDKMVASDSEVPVFDPYDVASMDQKSTTSSVKSSTFPELLSVVFLLLPLTIWRWLRKHTTLTHYIVLGMVLGILIGGAAGPAAVPVGKVLSRIFLRSVLLIIVPLIFSTLVVGIAGHGEDVGRVGRLFAKSIAYFELATTVALAVGLVAANLVRPGEGIPASALDPAAQLDSTVKNNVGNLTIEHELDKIFPNSFYAAAAENETLSIVACAIAFSIAIMWVKPKERKIMIQWCQSLSDIMFQVTYIVMLLAPIGIMGALMAVIGRSGFGVLKNLALLLGTLYGSLIVFVCITFIPILLVLKVSLRGFAQMVAPPAFLAFLTASSESALPMAMQRLVEFGVPQSIVAFVLPTGYSFNLDGTTLHLAIASRFAAQVAGVDQSIGTQLMMMLNLMLVSKGVAAVPRASIVILASTCASFKIPQDGILLLLGVDAFMDMARTSVNLVGNCLAAVVVSKWEGQFGVPDVVAMEEDEENPQDSSSMLHAKHH
jgi:proton glutamate symport protein